MVLTRGDDFPVHQTPDPIAYSGSDRNFYDRYFFNGYALEAPGEGSPGQGGEVFFAVAFGVYPHLNIADASFCLVADGVQTDLHASRWLGMERLDTAAGPISITVDEPLARLTVRVNAPKKGLAAELSFTGRAFPIEEPRFIRRNGPRLVMDYTRLTQNGRWQGWVERDGVRTEVSGYVGTRDRSWGIRPVGARDPQETAPPVPPQFFWLWAPLNFPTGSAFFHTNDDAAGLPWNRRACWAPDGADAGQIVEMDHCAARLDWGRPSRHATRAAITMAAPDGDHRIVIEPSWEFLMNGLGYGHPKWGHGLPHGPLEVEREDRKLAEVDMTSPLNLHVQALSKATHIAPDGTETVGRGVLEQLAIGPHAGAGLTGVFDPPPLAEPVKTSPPPAGSDPQPAKAARRRPKGVS